MVGRKRRQNVKRQPNGRPSPEKGLDPRAVAQLMPHRRLVPADVAHDPKAESLLGRLCLNGWITEAQYDAGKRYRDIVIRYRAVIDAPKPDERSLSGVIVGPWGGSGAMDDEEAVRRKAMYDAAFIAVSDSGQRAARAVARCAVHDRREFELVDLRCGLSALVLHFRLT